MKKYFSFLVLISVIGFWVSGCYKDKGNYVYQPANSVTISTTAANDTFTVASGDTLRINIQFSQTLSVPDSSLSYKWVITTPYNAIQPNPKYPDLSTQKNLKAQILEIPNNYLVTVEVTDKTSNVTFFKTFYVTVTPDASSMNEGWLVMEQASGGMDISYIPYPTSGPIIRNLYSKTNTVFLPSDAFSLNVVNTVRQNPNQEITILSGSDIIQAEYLKLAKVAGYSDLLNPVPAVRKPQAFNSRLQAPTALLLDNNNLYMAPYTAIAPAHAVTAFIGPYTGGVGNNNLKINPNIVSNSGSTVAGSGYDYYMIYDDLSQRFLYFYAGSATQLGPVNFGSVPTAGAPFDMNKIGKQLLNVDNTVDGYKSDSKSTFFYLFKNNNNDSTFLYQVANLTGALPTFQNNAIAVYPVVNAPGLSSSKFFTSSDIAYQVYYENGSDVYVLNAKTGISHIVYSFPAGTKISGLKLFKPQYIAAPTYAPANCSVLAVSTFESGQGKLYTFNLLSNGDISGSTYSNMFSGFGNIKDFAFKKVSGK